MTNARWVQLRAEELPAGLGRFRTATACAVVPLDGPRTRRRHDPRDLEPTGALVHISAYTRWGIETTAATPHPEPLWGYELHLAVQARDVKASNGVDSISLGNDVPPVTALALAPAGAHRGDAVIPALLARRDTTHVDEVIWDRGYSQLRPNGPRIDFIRQVSSKPSGRWSIRGRPSRSRRTRW